MPLATNSSTNRWGLEMKVFFIVSLNSSVPEKHLCKETITLGYQKELDTQMYRLNFQF